MRTSLRDLLVKKFSNGCLCDLVVGYYSVAAEISKKKRGQKPAAKKAKAKAARRVTEHKVEEGEELEDVEESTVTAPPFKFEFKVPSVRQHTALTVTAQNKKRVAPTGPRKFRK
jgi:hypothetical protein